MGYGDDTGREMAVSASSHTSSNITWRDRDAALYLPLLGGPKSAEANRAIGGMMADFIVPNMAGKQPRPSSMTKARRALGALVGDLCRYRSKGRDGKHGMSQKDFPSRDLGFGRTAFVLVKDALVAAGLIQFKGGWNRTTTGFDGGIIRGGGDVAFFRATPSLVRRLGELCGPDAAMHWSYGQPRVAKSEPLIVLRGKKGPDGVAPDLSYLPNEPGVSEILTGVEDLNGFLKGRVTGFGFAGIRRIYNDGDLDGKRWRRGGRYYSIIGGEPYEAMGREMRLSTIRLDDQPIAEVDIRASHLTILHGVMNRRFDGMDGDPYGVAGYHREAVKAWVNSTLGKGKDQWNRWPIKARDKYAEVRPGRRLEDDYRVGEVGKAVLSRYPFLGRLEADGINSLDLAWHEAELLTIAMAHLRKGGIASLPLHDALLVPRTAFTNARMAIEGAFRTYFRGVGVNPLVSLEFGELTPEESRGLAQYI